jgi:type IV secretion system protein TrbI
MATRAFEPTDDVNGVRQITDKTEKPKGVISKRTQQYVIVGIAMVILLVAMFSSGRQQKAAANTKPSAMPLQDVNERKLADFGTELTEQQKAAEKQRVMAQLPPPSNPAAAMNASLPKLQPGPRQQQPGIAYQPAYDASDPQPQLSEPSAEDALRQKERERAYSSRFASNLAFSASPNQPQVSASAMMPERSQLASLMQAQTQQDDPPVQTLQQRGNKKRVNVEVNSATGQPYVLFEGTTIEATLMNRLDGEFAGPVKVMVANSVYSHDRQHVLIPEGSTILGEVKPVEGLGQRRLAVVFHRMLMPDGYSVDLDKFQGLSQEGATGLKDKVNNHYMQIFGTSVALGVIAGAAEGSIGTAGIYQNGVDAYRAGVASSVAQSSTRVLDRFLSISPTLTIREGHRVKVYLTQDLLLPAYENHTVPPNI